MIGAHQGSTPSVDLKRVDERGPRNLTEAVNGLAFIRMEQTRVAFAADKVAAYTLQTYGTADSNGRDQLQGQLSWLNELEVRVRSYISTNGQEKWKKPVSTANQAAALKFERLFNNEKELALLERVETTDLADARRRLHLVKKAQREVNKRLSKIPKDVSNLAFDGTMRAHLCERNAQLIKTISHFENEVKRWQRSKQADPQNNPWSIAGPAGRNPMQPAGA